MSSLPPIDPGKPNIVTSQNTGKSYTPTHSNGTPLHRQSNLKQPHQMTKSETTSPIRQEHARPSSISSYPDVEFVSPRRSADAYPHTHLVPAEKCWKCLLKVDHRVHDTQRFIRIGGGYRHGYYYLQVLLEQIEIERQHAEILRARLETIKEKGMRMIKTVIRTKSGKLIEKIIMVSEEDYEKITKAMGGSTAGNAEVAELLKKYMSSEEAGGIQSLDTSEQKAITATFRTSSGRLVEKVIYVSKDDYEAMQRGEMNMNDLLAKQGDLKDLLGAGTTLEGWKESKMRTITTTIRTKSGRLIEQQMQITEEDYRQLQAGKDLGIVLKKYMNADQAAKVQGWTKPEKTEMMAIKTFIRTKSGRLIERTALLTKAEYEAFQRDGANPEMLKAFLGLTAADKIEKIGVAASVLSVSDDEAEEGEIVQDKQGNMYQYVVDPITGKLFKKKLDKVADSALIAQAVAKGAIRTEGGAKGGAKRNKDKDGNESDGSYSYQSVRSAGGTRHVMRQHKREDGTYSPAESFHGPVPQGGKKKKRNGKKGAGDDDDDKFSYRSEISAGGRRHVKRTRVHADGTRSPEVSDHGSVDSAGGRKKPKKTVKVLTKKPIFDEHGNVIGEELVEEEVVLADSDDEDGVRKRGSKAFRKKIIKVVKKKLIYDADGNVIGEEYVEEEIVVLEEVDGNEADDEDEGGGTRRRKKGKGKGDDEEDEYYLDESGKKVLKPKNKKKNAKGGADDDDDDEGGGTGKRKVKKVTKDGRVEYVEEESESDFSVYSVVSAGGTKKLRKKMKIRDKDGKVIGYADSVSNSSDDNDDDDDYSVYTEESEGGTKRVAKRKRIRDKSGKVIGYAKKQVFDIPEGVDNQDPDFIIVSDGKGGTIRIPRQKKGDSEKGKQGKRGKGKLPVSSLSPVFSEASTDEEEEQALLEGMTEEEKKVYLEEKEKRKKAREKRRIEKYGEEKYKEMAAEEEKRKKYRSMVTYSRGGSRFGSDDSDDRGIGLGHDEWGKKKKPRDKKADGNDSDASTTETFVEDADGNKIRVLRKGSKIIKKIKANGEEEDFSDNLADDEELVVETRNIYDEFGNIIGTKKIMQKRKKNPAADKKKKKKEDEEEVDDGDYFEKDEQGNYRLKPGKKKIDISKLSKEDLKKLGLDPDNMSKADMMRALKQKFGDNLEVSDRGKKIGTKRLSDYGYNPTIAELADDLDLDLSTLRGPRRLAVLQKRFGPQLQEHVRNLIDLSKLKDNIEPEEAAKRSIDFIIAYKLVDNSKLEAYAKAFAVEDEDLDHKLSYKAARLGLESVPSIGGITEKQMDYVMSILGIDKQWPITFRMFAVIVALCERVTAMDGYCKELIDIVNLLDIDRKLQLYKQMFYCNETSDRSATHIQIDALRIELIAGGLSWDQQDYVIEKLQPSGYGEVSFLDYLCYIPLFLSMHENICDNPLDMSNAKYQARPGRVPSPSIQRDLVPLGLHMRRNNMVHRSKFAEEARRLLNPRDPVDKETQLQRGSELLDKKPGGANLRNLMK